MPDSARVLWAWPDGEGSEAIADVSRRSRCVGGCRYGPKPHANSGEEERRGFRGRARRECG